MCCGRRIQFSGKAPSTSFTRLGWLSLFSSCHVMWWEQSSYFLPSLQIHMQLQVVQEELQELSHRLDTPPLSGQEELDQEELAAGGQAQLRTRMRTLKSEFTELMGELRRRSSIVEGVPMSFEVRSSPLIPYPSSSLHCGFIRVCHPLLPPSTPGNHPNHQRKEKR